MEKQHALQNSAAHTFCQDTWFQLDFFFLAFLFEPVWASRFHPSLPLSPIASSVSSFSHSLSQYVVFWTTVPCFAFMCSYERRFLTARHPVTDFKLWHRRIQHTRPVKHCGKNYYSRQSQTVSIMIKQGFRSGLQTAFVLLQDSEYLLTYGSIWLQCEVSSVLWRSSHTFTNDSPAIECVQYMSPIVQ